MRKNRIRLSESQLHKVIRESVKRILNEGNNEQWYCVWVADGSERPPRGEFAEEWRPRSVMYLTKNVSEEFASEQVLNRLSRRDMMPHKYAAIDCHLATKEDFYNWKNGNRVHYC